MEKELEVETRTVGAETVWDEQRGEVRLALMRFKKQRLYRGLSGSEVLAFSPLDEERFRVEVGGQCVWLEREHLADLKELVARLERGVLGALSPSGGGAQ